MKSYPLEKPPLTKEKLIVFIDLLAKRIEAIVQAIYTDGVLINEDNSGRILSLKSKLERLQATIRATRSLISRLKANDAMDAKRNRK